MWIRIQTFKKMGPNCEFYICRIRNTIHYTAEVSNRNEGTVDFMYRFLGFLRVNHSFNRNYCLEVGKLSVQEVLAHFIFKLLYKLGQDFFDIQ